jgi:hypothetical protein
MRSVLAEEGDSNNANDGNQGHEEGILHEAGATLRPAETSPQERSAEPLPIGNEVHDISPSTTRSE